MKKISVNQIVEFRRKTSITKISFISKIDSPRPSKVSKGGDYWTPCLSCISNFYITNDNNIILDKIEELLSRHKAAIYNISKGMYLKNINILKGFEHFDLSIFKPNFDITYISKPNDKSIIEINGIPIQIRPHHVYIYKEKNIKKIGAIWFVAKKDGFSLAEIAIFTDALYRYLNVNHSDEFEIDPEFCIAIDVVTTKDVRYQEILDKKVPTLLDSTLDSIKDILLK